MKLEVIGGKELQAKLNDIEPKFRNKVSRRAVRAGAKVVLPEVERRAPRKSGLLAESFKVRSGRRKKNRISAVVETAGGDFKGETFYGSFVTYGRKTGKRERKTEEGRANDKRRKNRRPRREIPPNPFIALAFDSKKDDAIRAITKEASKGLNVIAKEYDSRRAKSYVNAFKKRRA